MTISIYTQNDRLIHNHLAHTVNIRDRCGGLVSNYFLTVHGSLIDNARCINNIAQHKKSLATTDLNFVLIGLFNSQEPSILN